MSKLTRNTTSPPRKAMTRTWTTTYWPLRHSTIIPTAAPQEMVNSVTNSNRVPNVMENALSTPARDSRVSSSTTTSTTTPESVGDIWQNQKYYQQHKEKSSHGSTRQAVSSMR